MVGGRHRKWRSFSGKLAFGKYEETEVRRKFSANGGTTPVHLTSELDHRQLCTSSDWRGAFRQVCFGTVQGTRAGGTVGEAGSI